MVCNRGDIQDRRRRVYTVSKMVVVKKLLQTFTELSEDARQSSRNSLLYVFSEEVARRHITNLKVIRVDRYAFFESGTYRARMARHNLAFSVLISYHISDMPSSLTSIFELLDALTRRLLITVSLVSYKVII